MIDRIELTHETINDLLSRDEGLRGTYNWLNVLRIREMENRLRKAKGIPFYYGFADFDLDSDMVIFKPWPFYYKYSRKFRIRQLRHRLGRWIREVIVPRLME